ncbi:MAG: hypothetical protein Q9176_004519 [Flavoplaca citrina]
MVSHCLCQRYRRSLTKVAGFEDNMDCCPSFGLWAEILGASCRDHVVSGYKFIMHYYSPGDSIHMFGVARGAHTACVLTRMLREIGLLRRGNEDRAETAWKTFADIGSMCRTIGGTGSDANESNRVQKEIFKKRFCQDEEVCVAFLGLFDCVSPARRLDRAPTLAHHVRHAITMNRKNEPFKGMLFNQQVDEQGDENLEQLWFAGAHKGNGSALSSSQEDFLTFNNIPLAWILHEVRLTRCPLCLCVLRSDKQWGMRVSDLVAALENDVVSLIPGEAVKKPLSKDESEINLASTGSPPEVVTFLWKMLEVMIFILRFLILELSANHYMQQAGCRLFHPSVFVLYRKGVLSVEDTPQSIVAASRVIDNENNSTSGNATLSILNQAWCQEPGNEAWDEQYGTQKLEDLIAGRLEVEPTIRASEQDGSHDDIEEDESQPTSPGPDQQIQALKMGP